MGKSDLPKRSLYRPAPVGVNAKAKAAAALVLTRQTAERPSRNGDRHAPGYMAEYMRKRRAQSGKP